MALIVGLLGFGLLGSACSTAIREHMMGRKTDEPLVKHLWAVIARGLLAAVVVFLSVQGGLTVFASTSEPNPYALFLTCLLAAIFSETVWEWAQRQLADLLKSEGKKGDGTDSEEKTSEAT